MSRIFVSHSSVDWREAVALKQWLSEQRPELANEIFLDIDPQTGLRLGEHWDAQLVTSNSRCEYLICLLSPKWLASTECRVEFRTAEGFGKRILVARLEDTGPGDITGRWHRCDLFAAGARTEIAVPGGPPVGFNAAALDQLKKAIEGTGVGAELPLPDVAAPDVMVVGEIPRQPQAFVERATVQRLAEALDGAGVAVVCALTGLRGVGKTQVAAAYARARVAAGDGLVGWVNAESRDQLLAGLARIAQRVGVADPDGDSLKSAQRLREHLETRPGAALVVFDNAVDPDTLLEFLPAAGSTRVVITSTDRAFVDYGRDVDVTAFSRAESLAYLRQRTDSDDEAGAGEVAEELGDLPVALAQAAATIRGQRLTYPAYLQRLSRVPVAELLGRAAGQGYPRATAAALLLSIETTEDQDPLGVTGMLLQVVSMLSPRGVHRELLSALVVDESGAGVVDAAVERGVRGSLLSWSIDARSLIMHRLLGRVLRERDRSNGRWSQTLAAAMGLLEPHLFDTSQAWWDKRDLGSELVSQIEALWEATTIEPPDDPDILARALRARSWGVRQLRAAGDLTRAIDLGIRVAADGERVLGADHPDTLTSRHDLAVAYASVGGFDDAIPLLERTIADRQRVLGADHPDTLTSRHELAVAYQWARAFDEVAIALLERTVTDRERVLGADHPDTLTSRHDLAKAYRWAWLVHQAPGRLEEAIALFERTVTDRERVLGADHPDTLTSRDELAGVYQAAGRLDEAIALYEQTLADRQRVLGADHPEIGMSGTNLAYAYQSAGRLGEAITLLERAVSDHDRVGSSYVNTTVVVRTRLAHGYQEVGRFDEAIALFERSLTDTERAPDHPLTLTTRDNLAGAYQAAGRLEQAITLFERTLTDSERALGADHNLTLTTRDNLAGAYQAAGRLDEAITLFERTLADRERVLGADHELTLTTRHSLGSAYLSAGRLDEAIPLLER